MPPQHSTPVNDSLPFTVSDKRKRGYFTVDNVLLDLYGAQLGPYGIAVYCALARFANQDQECWPSFETVAKRTGMSRRQVIREIAKLVDLTIITATPQLNDKGEHKSNLYVLLDIVGGDSQSLPSGDSQSLRSVRQSPKQSLKKKDTHPDIDLKKAYRPDAYADIILG